MPELRENLDIYIYLFTRDDVVLRPIINKYYGSYIFTKNIDRLDDKRIEYYMEKYREIIPAENMEDINKKLIDDVRRNVIT